jgi:hypothetical protein
VCGRPLCIACAVLVRGGLVGSECLSAVLEDAPLPDTEPAPARTKGDRLAIAGFGFVLLLSLFPWSRFSGSGFFGAWTLHWSLVAVAAAAVGLAFALVARRRWSDPRLVAPIYALLGLVVAGGAFLAHRRPPPLAEPSAATWLAIIGAALVLIGAGRKIVVALRTRYPAS